MSRIERFEDLIAWKKARAMTTEIYCLTRQEGFARDYGLKNQIERASVSVMSNIAEGFERNRRGEFHQFRSISKASCAEVRSQLYVALDIGYINQTQFDQTMSLAQEVAKIIGGLRASIAPQK